MKILTFRQTEQMAFPFWFLTSLFTIHVLFCFISYLSTFVGKYSEYVRAFLIISSFILGNLTVSHGIKFGLSFNTSLIALLFYYIGYLYHKYESNIKMNIKYIIFPLVIMIISSKWRIDISTNIYVNPVFFVINSLLGIYLSLYISKKLDLCDFKILKYIGTNTIIIMALQFLGFYIGRSITSEYNLDVTKGYWIIISVFGVIIPLLFNYILKSIGISSSTLSYTSLRNLQYHNNELINNLNFEFISFKDETNKELSKITKKIRYRS